jgi:hypothetical protein
MGYGVFVFLPIDFINKYRKSKNRHENLELPFEKYKWGRDWIYITHNGFMGCSNNDLKKCTNIINSILFSITLLFDVRESISELDLNEFNVDHVANLLSSNEHHITSINHVYYLDSDLRDFPLSTPLVTKKQLDTIMGLAKEIYKSPNFTWQIAFYYGWSRFSRKEYFESFVLNWSVIEAYVKNKIRNYYKNTKCVSEGEVLNELENRQIYILLNVCRKKGLIKPKLFKKIDKMRKKRNNVIHGTSEVTPNLAGDCKSIANMIFWELLREAGINYNQYK